MRAIDLRFPPAEPDRDILARLESKIAQRRHFMGCEDYHVLCAAADEIRTLRRERKQLAAALDGYLFESGHTGKCALED